MSEPNDARPARSIWQCIVSYGVSNDADRANQFRLVAWTFAWAVSFVAATWLLRSERWEAPLTWLVAAAPILLGIAVVYAYLRMLHGMDELIRRVQLEGIAVGFGAGVVFGIGYPVLMLVGAPRWANQPVVVMFVAMTVGVFLAMRRLK